MSERVNCMEKNNEHEDHLVLLEHAVSVVEPYVSRIQKILSKEKMSKGEEDEVFELAQFVEGNL